MSRDRLPRRGAAITESAEQVATTLRARYEQHLVSPDHGSVNQDRQFLRGGTAEHLAENVEIAQLIKLWFCLYLEYQEREEHSLWRCTWNSFWHTKNHETRLNDEAETIYRTMLGDVNTPSRTRVNLFTILLFCEVPLHSMAWRRFVQHTRDIAEGGSTAKNQFSDRILRFNKLNDVQHWFGHDKKANALIYLNQHLVCPFTLNAGTSFIPQDARLPYIAEERVVEQPVGLYRVMIDPPYFRGSIPAGWVVRKDVPCDKTNEAKVDQRLKQQKVMHAHIRKIYGIDRSPERTHIFMEWTDEGSLEDYMRRDKIPSTRFETKIAWFAKLLGPADALRFMHHDALDPESQLHEAICHGDIRPDNIMLFIEDRRILLKISDFETSCIGQDGRKGCAYISQLVYCPPESMEGLVAAPAKSTKGDVWSMGCLLFEWLVWLWHGFGNESTASRGLQVFRRSCKHRPTAATGDLPNDRFFVVQSNESGSSISTSGSKSSRKDFPVYIRTENRDCPTVIELNPAIDAYVERIGGNCGLPWTREQNFVRKVFAVLKEHALVPNPAERGTMIALCDALKKVVESACSDIPQVDYN